MSQSTRSAFGNRALQPDAMGSTHCYKTPPSFGTMSTAYAPGRNTAR